MILKLMIVPAVYLIPASSYHIAVTCDEAILRSELNKVIETQERGTNKQQKRNRFRIGF